MLLWFIPIVILVIFTAWALWERESCLAIMGVAMSVLGLLIAMLFGLLLSPIVPQGVVETETHEIYALADNMQFEGQLVGNVFLTRGYIDEELKYNYMYKIDDKGYAFNSVNAKDSFLNTTNDTPCVVINHICSTSDVFNFLFLQHWDCQYEYIFYLPPNADIINDFTIDFE